MIINIKFNDISNKFIIKLLDDMEKSFMSSLNKNLINELFLSNLHLYYYQSNLVGYAIVYKKNNYYYLDKIFINNNFKGQKLGTIFLNHILHLYKKLLWRTKDKNNYIWYSKFNNVKTIMKYNNYYYLSNFNYNWNFEDHYIFNKKSLFI